ncbi:MAG TPA: CesT family type III secretion system chaperone [Candidatus Saccharimonadia bacterium]|nr:CesT family type III secretion system chaperone [Candidatus Saccharimonadia bacterium]
MEYSAATTLLNEQLKQLNLPTLDKDGRSMIRGPQGNRFMLELADDAETVGLYAPLTKVDDNKDKAALYEAALTLNLMPDVVGGASLAFDPRTRSLVLTQPLDVEKLDSATLTTVMSAFSLVSHVAGEALTGTPNRGRGQ